MAYIAMDFRNESANRSKKSIAKQSWNSAIHITLHKSLVLVPSSEVSKRDWRSEGVVAKKSFLYRKPEIEASFPMPP